MINSRMLPLIAAAETASLTREVFGNIPGWAKLAFYICALLATATFAYGCYRRWKLWRIGKKNLSWPGLGTVCSNLLRDVLLQRRVRGRGLASVAHISLFSGFLVLLIATTLIAIEHVLADLSGREATNPVFHKGVYYAIYELTTEAFGIALLVGVVLLLWRRLNRPASLGHNTLDWVVLILLLTIGVTGFAVEGLRIIREQTPQAGLSFVGWLAAQAWRMAGVTQDSVPQVHFGLWWFHAICSLAFIAAVPFTRLLHFVAGTVNLALPAEPLGMMQLVTLEQLEEDGQIGVGKLEDLSQRQLVMLDACVSCGRCEEACPAFAANKPLSPKAIVQDLRTLFGANDGQMHGTAIKSEALWSCTTCNACVTACPLGISPLGMITDMRRFLVGEAELRGSAATSLQKLQRSGNPWGLPPADRADWAKGLEVPTVHDRPDFDVLYWVGCAAAYDRRTQKVARAMVTLLHAAQVNFAVLGPEERCTGETARRLGDEFVFQELAESNVAVMQEHGVKRILTHCPHCMNSFKRDYPQVGFQAEVVHHTQFLAELIGKGALQINGLADGKEGQTVTLHDPCYLARVNGIDEEPREVLTATLSDRDTQVEMRRNRCNTACCGAGGGRMWMDDAADERIGSDRIAEAIATGADQVAVGCPFCLKMFDDGLTARDTQSEAKDVAELLAEAITGKS